jgi:dolichyl-phosphate-mannose--protein O-mannosyl transferase
MAGPIISALFGAASLAMLNIVLARLKTPEKVRWLLTAITLLHPNFVFLSASGMAETMILFFILLVLWGYQQMPYGTRSWVICGIGWRWLSWCVMKLWR